MTNFTASRLEQMARIRKFKQVTDAEASEVIGDKAIVKRIKESIESAGELLKLGMKSGNISKLPRLTALVTEKIIPAVLPAAPPAITSAIEAGLVEALALREVPQCTGRDRVNPARMDPAKIKEAIVAATENSLSPETAGALADAVVAVVKMHCHDTNNMLFALQTAMELIAMRVEKSKGEINSLDKLAQSIVQMQKSSDKNVVTKYNERALLLPEEYPEGAQPVIDKCMSESLIRYGSIGEALGIAAQMNAAYNRPETGSADLIPAMGIHVVRTQKTGSPAAVFR